MDNCHALILTYQYNKPGSLLKKMGLRNALWSERDRATLTMVEGSDNAHRTTESVYFGFGHAKVKGPGGPLIRYRIQKLKALNYPVYESYSSQFCVRCGNKVESSK